MGRIAVLSLLFACFVALAASDQEIKPVSEADLDAFVKEQVKSNERAKRDACTASTCPFGWVKYDNRCFFYVASPVDWITAETYCISLGANLVSVHSDAENQMVKALIRNYDPSQNPTWLGLSDCQKRFTWVWSDGSKFDFAKWNSNEPNNNNNECCVHINWASEKMWNDIPCELRYPFVCVKRLV